MENRDYLSIIDHYDAPTTSFLFPTLDNYRVTSEFSRGNKLPYGLQRGPDLGGRSFL